MMNWLLGMAMATEVIFACLDIKEQYFPPEPEPAVITLADEFGHTHTYEGACK